MAIKYKVRVKARTFLSKYVAYYLIILSLTIIPQSWVAFTGDLHFVINQ